ncbi:MAG TPA: BrnA antitoxin family protein [Pseudolabrys sp.]|nr:BrnA antitoxin family protein [Pseudolabrys sp.]
MARGPHPPDARSLAEKAFKAATTRKADLPADKPAVPGVRETVSLRIDRDVLDFFQADGPGWQERINAALRKAAGK